jgi:hypothetical protein
MQMHEVQGDHHSLAVNNIVGGNRTFAAVYMEVRCAGLCCHLKQALQRQLG